MRARRAVMRALDLDWLQTTAQGLKPRIKRRAIGIIQKAGCDMSLPNEKAIFNDIHQGAEAD